MAASARILVVDDDPAIADLVADILNREGFAVRAYTDSTQALASLAANDFDLAILDVMMPEMDGYELCARIRATSEMPLLFLSAKAEENDQVVGFALGADDYIAKPFRPRELVARVRARLRRRSPDAAEPSCLRCGDIAIDVDRHRATLLERPLDLTPTEFSILTTLARCSGRPIASRALYEAVWSAPADASSLHAVMVHIRNLRRKLAAIDGSKSYIENTWGVGYSLRDRP